MVLLKVYIFGSKELSGLPIEAINYIMNLCKEGNEIIIGDCYGVAAAVQFLLEEIAYENVTIYTARDKARINLCDWKEKNIITDSRGYRRNF